MNTIELAIGQVYIEDLGAGIPPRRMEIEAFYLRYVGYRTSQNNHHSMSRTRFEGLVKSGVFVLVDAAPAKNGMEFCIELVSLRAENGQLKLRVEAMLRTIAEYRKRLKSIQDLTFLSPIESSPK